MMADNKFSRATRVYGLTSDLLANRRNNGDTIVVSGVGTECERWAQVLTQRAAQELWVELTRLLFPEKSPQVLGLVQTVPLSPPAPAVTTRFEVLRNPDTHLYEILGWVDNEAWWFRVDEQNAHRLWAALDLALYPAGWSGPVIIRRKLN